MAVGKYHDWSGGRPLDPETDGCSYDEWPDRFHTCPFAVHPKGFLVFLPPDQLDASDEYRDADPYDDTGDFDTEFHRRRIQGTLALLEEALGEQRDGATILDIGCGKGHITSQIQRRFPMAEVSGLDYSLSAISHAAETPEGLDFAVGDAYDAPYSEGYFDVVVCNNLWEHVPDPLCLLGSMRRILKVGGHLLVSTPSRYHLGNLVRVVRGKPVRLMSDLHVTEYSVGQVIEQLRYGGFDVVRTYARPLGRADLSFFRAAAFGLLRPLVQCLIKMTGSHHSLESTVFFLARKGEGQGHPAPVRQSRHA